MHLFNKLLISVVFCLAGAASAFAIPTVTISSGSNGVVVVRANGLHSVGGVHVVFSYDGTVLANPRVSKGNLAARATLWAPNTGIPGIINLPLLNERGLPESGVIATINFDLSGSSPGAVRPVRVDISNMNGALVPSRVEVIDASVTAETTDGTGGSSGGSASSGDTTASANTVVTTETSGVSPRSAGAGGGAAPLLSGAAPSAPSEEQGTASAEAPGEDAQETTRPTSETPASEARAGEPVPAEMPAQAKATPDDGASQLREGVVQEEKMPAITGYQSVLEQLHSFTGPGTPKALMEIFSKHSVPGVRQEPAIALSDGSSKLRLFITLRSAGSNAPNFSPSGAKLVSLKPEPDGSWVVEALPAKGSYRATLTILQGDAETVIPLLVAPPLPGGSDAKLTESGFAQLLSERGTEKVPRFDLNGDGRRDYIDDYIFTANYLARKGAGPHDSDIRRALTGGDRGSHPGEGTETAK